MMLQPRKRMRRREHENTIRSLTFSCYRRIPLFANPRIADHFVEHLSAARDADGFHLYAWVIMPEHVHLLLWPDLSRRPLADVLRDLKRKFAIEIIGRWRQLNAPILSRLLASDGTTRFWQRGGGFDRNIISYDTLRDQIDYIHRNPVARGLVESPADWRWSSARWYAGDTRTLLRLDPLPPRKPGPSGAAR